MKQKQLPTNVKAIISKANGQRFTGETLTNDMLEFAVNNRDRFSFVYTGDVTLEEEIQEPEFLDLAPVFTKKQLSSMEKSALLDICSKRGIIAEGDYNNNELVAMILEDQKV